MSSDDGVVAVYPDDSSVTYTGSWSKITQSNTTLAFAQGYGKGIFKFTGTQVAVIGAVETGLPVRSSYSIDGGSSQYYIGPYGLSSPDVGIEFFISSELTPAEHQLQFEVLNATSDYPFILQYILYASSSSDSASATSSGAASTDTTGKGTSGYSATHQSTSLGAIIGGAVGGVVGLAILAIILFFILRKRGKGRPYFYAEVHPAEMLSDDPKPSDMAMSYITPYPPTGPATIPPVSSSPYSPPASSTTGPGPVSGVFVASPTQPAPVHSPTTSDGGHGSIQSQSLSSVSHRPDSAPYPSGSVAQRPSLGVVGHSEGSYASNQPRSRKAVEAGILSVPRDSTYHEDSGLRFASPGAGSSSASGAGAGPAASVDNLPADAPPSYSEH